MSPITVEELIRVVSNILTRARADEFGKIGSRRPGVYVNTNPFSVTIGNVYLTRAKATALAEGKLRIEPRDIGWVLVGEPAREPRPAMARKLRRPPQRETWEERRAAYVGAKSVMMQRNGN